MPKDPINRLTERQKEALRFLFAHRKAGEIATLMGISVNRVNQLFRSSREKMGVTRTIYAAKMLVEAEANPSHKMVAQELGVSGGDSIREEGPSSDAGTVRQTDAVLAEAQALFVSEPLPPRSQPVWPVPTADRPFNGLTWYQKLAWGIAVALGATVLAGAMISLQNAIH